MQLLLTYKEAARELGLKSDEGIRKLIQDNKLKPVYPLGTKTPRIHGKQLQEFVDSLLEVSCLEAKSETNKPATVYIRPATARTGNLASLPPGGRELGDLLKR